MDMTDFGYQQVPSDEKQKLVRNVFESVAKNYDIMNDVMSLGIHRLWKKIFVNELYPRPHAKLLDLAGGTGDISFQWLDRNGGPVLLTDINKAMLSVGRDRATNKGYFGGNIDFACINAEEIPLQDCSVDRVSIAFGLRNCTNKEKVLKEAYRVLRPGGRFCCLEFSKVQIPVFSKIYDEWSFKVLPQMGKFIAKDAESYRYLAESIRMFPDQETLLQMMNNAGMQNTKYQNLSGGIAAIHSGWRF
ncbi:class I SAM-dependent methyltransferase [Acetobacteraceae bacterium]|nr:class I SAM-dependent methyltransferase [Acetobacteraceae bacterium]